MQQKPAQRHEKSKHQNVQQQREKEIEKNQQLTVQISKQNQ